MTRILIVDDQPHFRRQLRALLAYAGLTAVDEAGSIAEACTVLRATQPDLAVIDVMLPEMNGIVGVSELKALHPGLRVILVSAYNLNVFHQSARAAGAEAFIPKDELDLEVVRAWRRDDPLPTRPLPGA